MTPDERRTMDAQGALHDDITALVAYGEMHPDSWGGVAFGGASYDRVQVRFTDPQAHAAAVRRLVEHPESLDVLGCRWSEREQRALQQQLADLAEVRSVGSGQDDQLDVTLRADAEQLAQALHEQHGGRLQLTVGLLPFPPGPERQVTGGGRLPTETPSEHGLALHVEVRPDEVAAGQDVRGVIVVRNVSPGPVTVETGRPVVGTVLDEEDQPVGGWSGGLRGTGLRLLLAPAESHEIDVLSGTASLHPALGYVLPPGLYQLAASLEIHLTLPAKRSHRRGRRTVALPATPGWFVVRPPG